MAAELAHLGAGGGADILFVGRIVPSKAQHELVKALWAYRRLYDPKARLHLVGGTSSFAYTKALQEFVDDLGLSAAVRLPGEVSDAALAAYFGAADVYLSLSAHEGFGVPLVEAMVAGVPVVHTRRRCGLGHRGGRSARAGGGRSLLHRRRPAPHLHRRAPPRHADRRGARRAGRALGGCRGRPHHRGGRRRRGGPVSPKVAFVTPRYGPEIMGGAETAVRQLAEHLSALTEWEAEVHTTCALDAITWDDVLEPGTTEVNGVTVHRHPSAHGRLPDFYGLDGTVRLAPRLATREQGKRWVDYNGPVSPQLVDAVVASDADVVAFSPYLYHPTVATIGKVRVPAVFHPAAHDEPALYLPVFRGTFGDADAFCFYTASERTLVERMYQVAERPQIVLGLGVGESEGAGRPGGELLGLGDRPYIVSVGRVDEHKGSKMLASYFATYKERHPGPLALALVGPVSVELPPHPDIVVTGAVAESDKWDIMRDALGVGLSVCARVVLARGDRGLGRAPARPGQRLLRADPGALRALGRRAVVHLLPGIRGGTRPARVRRRAPGRAGAARARLRRPALPVAGARGALRRVPHHGRGAGEGHPRPVLTAQTRGGSRTQVWGRPTTVYMRLVDGVARDVVGQVVALGVHASSRSARSRAAPAWTRRRPGRSTTSWSGGAPPRGRSA